MLFRSGFGSYVGYDFGTPVVINKYTHKDIGVAYNFVYRLEASNDKNAQEWTPLVTTSAIATADTWYEFEFNNTTAYKCYRVVIVSGDQTVNYTQGRKIQLYAKLDTTIIHSAPLDTIYYLDNGSPIVVAMTNEEGIGEIDISYFDEGYVTLYSSVAKDLSNTSNDYSKAIRITKTPYGETKEIWLMPDTVKTLYWWGYVGDNLENASSANGWSWSGRSFVDPTYNTHDIQLSTGSGQIAIVGNKNAISCSKVYSIARATNDGLEMKTSTSKNVVTSITGTTSTSSSTNSLLQVSQTVANGYVTIICQNTQVGYASAFWYE